MAVRISFYVGAAALLGLLTVLAVRERPGAQTRPPDGVPRRRIAHLLGMYGFVLYVISTVVMVFNFSVSSIWPQLWWLGGLTLPEGVPMTLPTYTVWFRGRPACPCLAEWLPVFEAELIRRGVIKPAEAAE